MTTRLHAAWMLVVILAAVVVPLRNAEIAAAHRAAPSFSQECGGQTVPHVRIVRHEHQPRKPEK